jgi:uncharacterized protein (UPF0261 family)
MAQEPEPMPTVALVGTLDTKGQELAWVQDALERAGARVVLIDVGVFSDARDPQVTAAAVAAAAGADLGALRDGADRGAAMHIMGEGAAAVLGRLAGADRIDAVLALGGSGGSSIASAGMRALPVGLPKLLVSTMASGDVSPYVGESDVTIMYSVVDVAGINAVSERVLGNAAVATAAMAGAHAERRSRTSAAVPTVAVTMFGVTTPAADEARARLVELGYEVLVFHATGSGGRAMERLAASGLLVGVLDLTTTELADELVGGVLSAGPDRLTAAGRAGIPQVISVGALDMVNFGQRERVPAEFADRTLLVHNPTVTLMRTTPGECAALGGILAQKALAALGPVEVVLPMLGVSAVAVEGGPFHDPGADAALFAAIDAGLDGTAVPVHRRDQAINDPGFGGFAADRLHALISGEATT